MTLVEIACNSYASCVNAIEGGADRIELFENLSVGGCTPSVGTIRKSLELPCPIYVMIRPRGGDFYYNNDEIDIMISDIELCKVMGVKGIVFGCLTASGTIEKETCRRLMNIWNGPATFHRAIDRTSDIMQSCREVIDLGFERILSSGGAKDVINGIDTLKQMNLKFGKEIIIMPGAGVNSENARHVVEYTGCKEIHSTCKKTSTSNIGNMNSRIEDEISYSSVEDIRELVSMMH